MRHVDLCSGIGGFALGFEWAGLSKPVLFCDIEPWSRKILAKHWPDVPIVEDVKELANDPDGLVPDCDILTAGYPCQPFSVAGQRRGSEDDRHIWPYILSIIQAKRPSWCVFENVYGHISLGLDEVLSSLAGQEYAARPFIVPACGVDAWHRRDRLWIIARNVGDTISSRQPGNDWRRSKQEPKNGCKDVADTNNTGDRTSRSRTDKNRQKEVKGWKEQPQSKLSRYSKNVAHAASLHSNVSGKHTQQGQRQEPKLGDSGSSDDVADAASERLQGAEWQRKARAQGTPSGYAAECGKDVAYTQRKRQQGQRPQGNASNQETDGEGQAAKSFNGSLGNFWLAEPAVGRVAHGIPRRVDRLRGLGNAIVPQIAQRIGQTIKQVEAET